MDNLKIIFQPPKEDFDRLMEMLIEYKFYNGSLQPHDLSRIQKSYSRNGFIAHYINDIPVGFSVWSGEKQCAEMEYKWLAPIYRGKGYGKEFGNLVYEEFVKRKIYYVVAIPATVPGHGMADHFGFKPLAESDYRFSTSFYYLFLRKNRPQVSITGKGYELLIWHDYDDRVEPAQVYSWDDTMSDNTIITIVDSDAAVEIRKDGIPIKRNVCKYIFSENEIQHKGLFFLSINISEWLKMHPLGTSKGPDRPRKFRLSM